MGGEAASTNRGCVNRKCRFLLVTAFAMLMLIAGGGPIRAQERLKVGLVAPLTGPFADRGLMVAAGAKLYQDLSGRCPVGRPLEVIMEDSSGDPGRALNGARKLIEKEKVDFLLGFVTAGEAFAVASLTDGAKIPAIVLSSADALPQRSAYFVRTSYDRSSLANVLASFARETDSRRFATLAKESSLDFVDKFKSALRSPQDVTLALRAPRQGGDFRSFAGQIRNNNGQALLVAGIEPDELRQFMEGLASQPNSAGPLKIITTGELTEGDRLAKLGDAALGLFSVWHYNEDGNNAFTRAFKESNRDRDRDREPTVDAVAAFDGMHLIYEALKKTAGNAEDKSRLIEAMKGLKWESPRGAVAITAGRDIDQSIYLRRVDKTGPALANSVVAQYAIDGTKVQRGSGGGISIGDGRNCSGGGGGVRVGGSQSPGPSVQPTTPAAGTRASSEPVQTFVNGTKLTPIEKDRLVQATEGLNLSDDQRGRFGLTPDATVGTAIAPVLALGAQRIPRIEADLIRQFLDQGGIKPGMPQYPDAVATELLKRFPDLGGLPVGGFHPHQVRPGFGGNSDDNKMTNPGRGASGPAPARFDTPAPTSDTNAVGSPGQSSTERSAEGTTTVAGKPVRPHESIAVDKLIYPTPGPDCTAVSLTTKPVDQAAFHSGATDRAKKVFCRYGFTDVVFITFPGDAGQNLCSGAFLTPTHVLTAAHCARNATAESIEVFAPQARMHNCLQDKVRIAAGDTSKLTGLCQLPIAKVKSVKRATEFANTENMRALDIAVLELESVPRLDGKPITPRLVELGPVTAGDTMELTMAGYGLSALQDDVVGGTLQVGWSLLDDYVDKLLTRDPDAMPVLIRMTGVGQRTVSCAGDSGAPIFAGRLFGWRDEVRRIVGVVHSGTSISGCKPDDRTEGRMSPLLHPAAIGFICASTGDGLPICGAK